MISTDSTCRQRLRVGRIIWPRSIYGFQAAFCLMRKLTWFGPILLTLVVCTTSVSHAQKIRYEYAGPLDGFQTVPVSEVIAPEPAHRIAGLEPAKKLRPAYPSASSVVVGRITGASALPPSNQTTGRMTGQVYSTPRPTRAIREVLTEVIPAPTFSGPLTKSTGQVLRRNESTQHGYSGALTDPSVRPAETNYVPRRSDSAQFGSSSRALTNPRSRPVDSVYVPTQEDSTQYGHPRAVTNPRNYPTATNSIPRQTDSAQFGSARSFTSPRVAPVEASYIPRQEESAQYGYSEALTDHGNHPVETNYVPAQDDSFQPSYAGALTNPGGYQTEAGYIPPREDPTRFGYRDGEAFGFNNTRLFNPREGPQLDLQGAPTVAFGEPGCDEWANFGRGRHLEFDAPCGGMKAKPGHLGIPWLGSKENCDERIPLLGKRGLSSRRGHAAEGVCETCGSCPTCGR